MDGKFPLGQVVATPGALAAFEAAGERSINPFLRKHAQGDWGIVDAEDKQANDDALINEGRLLSAYNLKDNTKIWIITEWNRSVTTILLPSEY